MSQGDAAPDLTAMSAYERRAWEASIRRLNASNESPLRVGTRRVIRPIASTTRKAWDAIPGHEAAEEQLIRAMEGLVAVTLEPAMNSVSLDKVEHRVGLERTEFHTLDLRALDQAFPRTRGVYTTGALVQGGTTALAVTGAEVATTVSGGTTAAVAIGAIATDVAASIGLMGRIVGLVAAHYGYDVREPDEEVFALGAISVGSASSPSIRIAALASLSRLTQQMMRQATWAQLNNHAVVRVVDVIFKALGLRLTKQKLGQAIPVLGVLINGGLSAQMADQTYRRARDIYRLRFLSDKYDIDPSAWLTAKPATPDEVLGAAFSEVAVDAAEPTTGSLIEVSPQGDHVRGTE